MRGTTTAAICAVLLSACSVEQTPAEFIDHREPTAADLGEAAGEVQARLLALGQALGRYDSREALEALSPAADVYLVVPDRSEGLVGQAELDGVLRDLAGAGTRPPYRMEGLEVDVAPRGNAAWFRTRLRTAAADSAAADLRLTGVFLRGDEGEWRLVQAHLSSVRGEASPAPSSPVGDEAPREAGS